jgi:hypothetical protein
MQTAKWLLPLGICSCRIQQLPPLLVLVFKKDHQWASLVTSRNNSYLGAEYLQHLGQYVYSETIETKIAAWQAHIFVFDWRSCPLPECRSPICNLSHPFPISNQCYKFHWNFGEKKLIVPEKHFSADLIFVDKSCLTRKYYHHFRLFVRSSNFEEKKCKNIDTRSLYHKTYYGPNLQFP